MKKLLIVTTMLLLLCIAGVSAATNTTVFPKTALSSTTPAFTTRMLKYDPFPVNPGDWIDVWVLVENAGDQDAENATFSIEASYPVVEAQLSPVTFPLIPGKSHAYDLRQPDEKEAQANQVIAKFHLHIAPSADAGTYQLKLHSRYGGANDVVSYLPIDVEKTKTDFLVTVQQAAPDKVTLALTNIGEKAAGAITVSSNDTQLLNGPATVVVGTLNTGDFTAVPFTLRKDLANSTVQLHLTIGYTDVSGSRSSVDRVISVAVPAQQVSTPVPNGQGKLFGVDEKWAYSVLALIVGILVGVFLHRRPHPQ